MPLDLTVEPLGQIASDANDLDGDRLADSEELSIGLNPYSPDQDANLESDGAQLARQCAEIIERMPVVDANAPADKGVYKIGHMMRGLEWCPICGASVNMGYWQIVDSESDRSMDVPDITLHFLQHGSFSYLGDVHVGGRIEIDALLEILGLPRDPGDLGIPYDPADLNRDGTVDIEDFTEFAQRWLDATDPMAL